MFQSARLKLTAWYLLIIMFISLFFSLIIYGIISQEVTRFARSQRFQFEHRSPGNEVFILPLSDMELVRETKHRLALSLLVVNGAIFSISACLGYFLAGRTLRPIREMVNEQKRFITDSSHELRTPLTALKSSLEIGLRDKKMTLKDAKSLLTGSIEEVNKLQSLSDELLKLAQYQNSTNHKLEILSLDEVITQAVNRISPLAKIKNISLKFTSKHFQVYGDKYGLIDVMVILLDNAVKYSSPSTLIVISAQKTNGNVKISVTDSGFGISPKDLPHIFDRFYRADQARSKNEINGYGLGLSIAQKIVTSHHGSISVKSQINKGSIFTINLPLH